MNWREYQHEAARTLIDEPDEWPDGREMMIVWCALGLAGEAGEVVEHVKKGALHRHGIDADKMKDELGDVLWYLTSLCTLTGITLDDVARHNVDKLRARYPNGWSVEDSKHQEQTP